MGMPGLRGCGIAVASYSNKDTCQTLHTCPLPARGAQVVCLERRLGADVLLLAVYDPARRTREPGQGEGWGDGAGVGVVGLDGLEPDRVERRWVELWAGGSDVVVAVEVAEASGLKAADAVASDPYVRVT